MISLYCIALYCMRSSSIENYCFVEGEGGMGKRVRNGNESASEGTNDERPEETFDLQ